MAEVALPRSSFIPSLYICQVNLWGPQHPKRWTERCWNVDPKSRKEGGCFAHGSQLQNKIILPHLPSHPHNPPAEQCWPSGLTISLFVRVTFPLTSCTWLNIWGIRTKVKEKKKKCLWWKRPLGREPKIFDVKNRKHFQAGRQICVLTQ